MQVDDWGFRGGLEMVDCNNKVLDISSSFAEMRTAR
jgi:hypothetical protein